MASDDASALRSGPQNPLAATPEPALHSMRRTWNIDIGFPAGLEGAVVADIRGRDLRTGADGKPDVVDELTVAMEIDPATATIGGVTGSSLGAPLAALSGACIGSGFGRRIADLFARDGARRSLCYSPLEDLAGAYFVSGYAHLLEGLIPPTREYADAAVDLQSDICIGWAADGPFIETTRAQGRIPIPVGPAAPDAADGDRNLWHAMAPLTPPTVRRRRRLDVFDLQPSGAFRAQEHFRDSYTGVNGEQVMHEYVVDAEVDGHGRVAAIDVAARVLPWRECPGAATGAQRVVGVALEDLAALIRTEITGATTCTHLNSTLRTLADVRALAHTLRA